MSADAGFRDGLARALPALRAFARGLARDATLADDLVQETLLKAWSARDSFTEGTNLRAWLFTILRNAYYSQLRKRRREIEDADGAMAAMVTVEPGHDMSLLFRDFMAALQTLPAEQREALMLIGAAGLSYEDAASVCGCAVGTIKSRINRGRARLATLLDVEDSGALFAENDMEPTMATARGSLVA
jgi:RNA polymerase sigma-70 factor (ECF subfamily)